MIQSEHHEREARDASREFAVAVAITFGIIGLALITVALL